LPVYPGAGVGSVLDALERRSVAATQQVAFAGVIAMLVIAFTTVADVLLRWLFNSPITGLNEIVGMGMAVAVAATFPAGAMQRINLTIDLLHDRVSQRLSETLKLGASVLLLLFYVLLAWRVGAYAQALEARAAQTIYLQLPMAPFIWTVTAFIAISAAVQFIVVLVNVRCRLSGIRIPAGWSIGAQAQKSEIAVNEAAIGSMPVLGVGTAILAATAGAVFLIYEFLAPISAVAASNPLLFSAIVVLVLWLLLVMYVPLGVVMGLLGLFATIMFIGLDPALTVLGNESIQFLTNYQVAVLPLFLMMGSFAVAAGMSADIYELAHTLLGHRRGGLALATIGGCAGFGALTGSSLATVATIGRVALPEMGARGYSTALAAGSVAAGGTLGALIPPSIPLVFYALLTETSIGQLFIAAIVPGIITVLLYLLAIWLTVRITPSAAPPKSERSSASHILAALRRAWAALLLLTVVVGAIYSGICTETEAAAIGAGGAFVVALARRRINRATLLQVMGETTATTALIYLIIVGVLMFSFSMGVTGLPRRMTDFVTEQNLAPLVVLTLILFIYLALGAIMDSNTVMFITIPIVTPLIMGMGFDLVWWGIVNLIVLETGLISPPFGIHLFVLKSIAGVDVPLPTVYRGVLPFVIADLMKLILIVLVPALALWLPATMIR
jgi:tripartite ATP-independent transporter DctM subunit